MTVDARRSSARMPGPVLVAAVLLGLGGGLAGFGLIALGALKLGDGGEVTLAIGAGVLTLAFAAVVGLIYRNRIAQIGAITLGLAGVLGGITQLIAGNPVALLWLAVSAALMALLGGPMSSRMWFTR